MNGRFCGEKNGVDERDKDASDDAGLRIVFVGIESHKAVSFWSIVVIL